MSIYEQLGGMAGARRLVHSNIAFCKHAQVTALELFRSRTTIQRPNKTRQRGFSRDATLRLDHFAVPMVYRTNAKCTSHPSTPDKKLLGYVYWYETESSRRSLYACLLLALIVNTRGYFLFKSTHLRQIY